MEYIKDFLKNVRTDYNLDSLDDENSHHDPIVQFALWMKLAVDSNLPEPNAMNLATVSPEGIPSSRIVLLRNFDNDGFVFFTNYLSKKSNDLNSTNKAAINFFWAELHKQVRIEGVAEKVEDWDSDDYFQSRPRDSKLGTWVSSQSQRLTSREELEKKIENLTKEYEGKEIPRPPFWGGYRIKPFAFEFWQGRQSRLHDRLRYELSNDNQWSKFRLYP